MATAVKRRLIQGPDRATRELSHVDQIESVVKGERLVSGAEEVAESWRRSTIEHHVDANSRSAPHILTESELRVSREPVANIIANAQEEINRLYAIVGQADYVVLLCSADGVAVHHRGKESQASEFKQWGIWGGAVWSEEVEGTNGIGTCITEQRPVDVHREQHYRTRNTNLSCSTAPIFDATGRLVAVLDSSSFNAEASDRSHALVLAATTVSARAVEERLFRESFSQAWNIAAVPSDDSAPPLLLAVDKDQRVIGADRVARSAFGIGEKQLRDGIHLSTLYEHESSLFRQDILGANCLGQNNLVQNSGQDIWARWAEADVGREWRVLITPPAYGPGGTRISGNGALHSRPRISMLGDIPATETATSSLGANRGGLPPRLTSRIREYIDSHLNKNISLDAMAQMAGLSVFHFARAFRQSFGMPPHSYLLRRRIEHGRRLLQQTELALTEIALSTGFSDHSHFAKHFRRLTGMTPSAARWHQR